MLNFLCSICIPTVSQEIDGRKSRHTAVTHVLCKNYKQAVKLADKINPLGGVSRDDNEAVTAWVSVRVYNRGHGSVTLELDQMLDICDELERHPARDRSKPAI